MAPMVAAFVIALIGAAIYTLMLSDDARLSKTLESESPDRRPAWLPEARPISQRLPCA